MTQEKNQTNHGENASSGLAQKLADLRQQLQRDELEWPPTAVSLLTALHALNTETDASPQDFDMLSLAVDAASQGHDIAEAYPEFYQRMQLHPELQQAFSDILEMLNAVQEDEALPIFPPLSLDFLYQDISPKPVVTHHAPNRWRASWQLISAYLNRQFALPLETYRSGASILDEENTLLLHGAFEVGASAWQATLEALLLPESPGQVHLFLSAAAAEETLPPLEAGLRWGAYRETAVLDRYGRAHFPPLDLNLIFDKTGATITHDMHVDLRSI